MAGSHPRSNRRGSERVTILAIRHTRSCRRWCAPRKQRGAADGMSGPAGLQRVRQDLERLKITIILTSFDETKLHKLPCMEGAIPVGLDDGKDGATAARSVVGIDDAKSLLVIPRADDAMSHSRSAGPTQHPGSLCRARFADSRLPDMPRLVR
jgi:hypothetical protein